MNTDIPERLQAFAKTERKELWQLTTPEIKNIMSCDAKKAKDLKDKCNQTKEL